MNHKKNDSPITPEYIQKLIEENDKLKAENQNLKAKVGDLTIVLSGLVRHSGRDNLSQKNVRILA